jgi:hypothetical protein
LAAVTKEEREVGMVEIRGSPGEREGVEGDDQDFVA